MYVSMETGTLLIRDVAMGDEGLYHCELRNIAGAMLSRTAALTVTATPPAQGAGEDVCMYNT